LEYHLKDSVRLAGGVNCIPFFLGKLQLSVVVLDEEN